MALRPGNAIDLTCVEAVYYLLLLRKTSIFSKEILSRMYTVTTTQTNKSGNKKKTPINECMK